MSSRMSFTAFTLVGPICILPSTVLEGSSQQRSSWRQTNSHQGRSQQPHFDPEWKFQIEPVELTILPAAF